MAKAQLEALQGLVDRILADQSAAGTIVCKHFFSGAAAYVDGQIFMTLTPAGLALKLSEPDRTQLMTLGAAALRYFPNAPIKKDYVVAPDSVVGDDAALTHWALASIAFAAKTGV
jgi:TfoX/Sxy family transcriptional regulator of competence genes